MPAPFEGAKFDRLTFVSCPVEMFFKELELAHGTGIIWRNENGLNLITNWHNVTGKNPFNNSLLNKGGSVPDRVRVHVARRELTSGKTSIVRDPIDISLYEHFADPFWKQHKEFEKQRIDVVSLPFECDRPETVICLQDYTYENIFTHVGSDVFIVGFPSKDYKQHMPPIWKRGSLASEPLLLWHDKPAFLIDAASRAGMSGSPVFRRVFGPVTIVQGSGLGMQLDNVMATNFIGIYSGHLSDIDDKLTIGIAWPSDIVEAIMEFPAPGTRD